MQPRDIIKKTPFFAEGATPIEEDGPGHSMFVVVSGRLSVTIDGEDEPVATLAPGDIFGEMSLLTGARRSATVTAIEPVEAMEVSKEALAHVLARSPTLVDRFVEMLMRRQRELDKRAGGAAWGMLRPGKAELANMIGAFFGKAI